MHMKILRKAIILVLLISLAPVEMHAFVCTSSMVTMSYAGSNVLNGYNRPSRIPAYKECPVKVLLDSGTGTLTLDNTKCPNSIEYGIYNEAGQTVLYGTYDAYSYNNINLNTLSKGVYQFRIQVGTSTYVGTIDI